MWALRCFRYIYLNVKLNLKELVILKVLDKLKVAERWRLRAKFAAMMVKAESMGSREDGN